uniref:Thioredoxin domain-containing protein n=1 Tax=Hyaloperonospora arabidopsidis (strain Emoy2) TaxID=559515 RepID=M4B870_HYAAE
MTKSPLLQGVTLTDGGQKTVQGETLGQNGAVLALFFAADWCPDCRVFQPVLNRFYDAVQDQLDIVFVSSDASVTDQLSHLNEKQRKWWMVPFEDEKTRSQLKRTFGVCASAETKELSPIARKKGIPALVVIRPNGDVVDFEAGETIEREGVKAIEQWKK